ncbi:hypothetical protein IOD40_06090 [Aquamicrobium sp. cd-1]|uniref:Uncharacterized protein n=1 Tax=Aquamicrobium zhengzhouense TaxID=2781738 RepID=A0ABS0SAD1_9HYPH|nr:hypothetical protein [Aquamicrobium zhengzhouense]
MVKSQSPLPYASRFKLSVAVVALALALPDAGPAWALSELQREDVQIPEETEAGDEIIREQLPPPPGTEETPSDGANDAPSPSESQGEDRPSRQIGPVPFPDPVVIPQNTRRADEESGETSGSDVPVPVVEYDTAKLPEPVRRLREEIMAACLSGELERLRPLLQTGENATQLSFGSIPSDPIEFMRSISGDGEGHEIMAILYEVLASGYVLEEIEDDQMYIWPYFYSVPLDTLTPAQRVELFQLVTAGDYEDMKNFGGYIFYRVGITPDGRWQFFVAGD